jgi:hypothetical protein
VDTISIVLVIWRVLPIDRMRRLSSRVFAIVYAAGLPGVEASVFDFSAVPDFPAVFDFSAVPDFPAVFDFSVAGAAAACDLAAVEADSVSAAAFAAAAFFCSARNVCL